MFTVVQDPFHINKRHLFSRLVIINGCSLVLAAPCRQTIVLAFLPCSSSPSYSINNMIGIKNFATCECDLPAIGDPNTNPEYIYRFRCPTHQQQDGERGCDFSLTISLEDTSSTIPPYYKIEIEETDQKFESFHKKPLRAFLEWRGMTRK